MPDREKVIRGLECHVMYLQDTTTSYVPHACDDCPYNDDEDIGTCEYPTPLLQDALALLREQEPVEPIRNRETGTQRCGICRTFICSPPNRFCPNCGRNVKRNAYA